MSPRIFVSAVAAPCRSCGCPLGHTCRKKLTNSVDASRGSASRPDQLLLFDHDRKPYTLAAATNFGRPALGFGDMEISSMIRDRL
jgi:hypothetical protein